MNEDFDIQWYIDEGFGNPFEQIVQPSKKLIINAAITGMVPTREDTPYVPLTASEIVEDGIRCFKAGASVLHLHARDENGYPSYRARLYEGIILRIREACKDVIICVSTSGRVFNTFKCRSEVLSLDGPAKPDMASLTLGSMNFPKTACINSPEMIKQLATTMLRREIKPELEVFETGMVNYAKYLHRKGYLRGKQYFNLLLGSLGTMPARICDLEHLIDTLPEGSEWSGAGIGRFQLPMNLLSVIKGGHVRIGLEDNIYYDRHKKVLATNEQLITRMVDFAKSIGRDIATPREAAIVLGLEKRVGETR